MSEEKTIEHNEENDIPTEIDTLKSRADQLGIRYNSKIGVDKLREKINRVLEGQGAEEPEAESEAEPATSKASDFVSRRKRAAELVRVQITCMNPNKKEWSGEIFSAGSSKLGTFKKYVPYNVEWHVPRIMLDMIKDRQFSAFRTVTAKNGQKVRKGGLVKEFGVVELPPLTKKEIEKLARQQAMQRGDDADE